MGIALGGFPSWAVGGASANLFALAFAGCQIQYSGTSRWAPGAFRGGGGQTSMPVTLYDAAASQGLTQGPATDFFVAVHEVTATDTPSLNAGPMASVWTLPAGYTYSTLLAGGPGIAASLEAYGAALLKASGKDNSLSADRSFVLSHLGYWVE